MNTTEARDAVLAQLAVIAPEADLDLLDPDADLRTEIDLDSMDFLNLVVALAAETGVDIPDADYGRVRSLSALTGYLVAHSPTP
ncbi:MAG TPA: acyl carrier protein [Actinomycetes bacterium]|nr:acyl carrier protein [Actinomycetes bacterium]